MFISNVGLASENMHRLCVCLIFIHLSVIGCVSSEKPSSQKDASPELARKPYSISEHSAFIWTTNVNEIVLLLKHEHPLLRLNAASLLSLLGDPKAVGPLIEALKDTDFVVRIEAELGLKKMTGQDFSDCYVAWKKWFTEESEYD